MTNKQPPSRAMFVPVWWPVLRLMDTSYERTKLPDLTACHVIRVQEKTKMVAEFAMSAKSCILAICGRTKPSRAKPTTFRIPQEFSYKHNQFEVIC